MIQGLRFPGIRLFRRQSWDTDPKNLFYCEEIYLLTADVPAVQQ
jgi:hypothetical protein